MNEEYLMHIIEKYRIDYVVHGDDPCLVDGKDVYETARKLGTTWYISKFESADIAFWRKIFDNSTDRR